MNDLVVIGLFCGVGCLAGMFLDVFEFIMLAVMPSLLMLAAAQFAFQLGTPWYVFVLAWILQQMAYALGVIVLRPLAGRPVVKGFGTLPDR